MVVLLSVIFILIFIVLFSVYFFFMAFVRRRKDESSDIDSKENDFLNEYRPVIKNGINYINSQPYKWVYCKSYDGLTLAARYFDMHSHNTVILFHGYRSSANRDFSCAVRLYCEQGYNVLLADQRSHGKSEGKLITFGVKERYDAVSWAKFYTESIDPDSKIILGGMSMGATTVLLAAGLDLPENVKGIIADCGFTSPVEIIKKVARQSFHINASVFLPIMNLLCIITGHFGIYGVSTEKSLAASKLPVLFIHGKNDNFVPCEMSERNYKGAAGEKEILLVDGADHGMSYLVDTHDVEMHLRKFLNKISA